MSPFKQEGPIIAVFTDGSQETIAKEGETDTTFEDLDIEILKHDPNGLTIIRLDGEDITLEIGKSFIHPTTGIEIIHQE